jgi:hypothetical protein
LQPFFGLGRRCVILGEQFGVGAIAYAGVMVFSIVASIAAWSP